MWRFNNISTHCAVPQWRGTAIDSLALTSCSPLAHSLVSLTRFWAHREEVCLWNEFVIFIQFDSASFWTFFFKSTKIHQGRDGKWNKTTHKHRRSRKCLSIGIDTAVSEVLTGISSDQQHSSVHLFSYHKHPNTGWFLIATVAILNRTTEKNLMVRSDHHSNAIFILIHYTNTLKFSRKYEYEWTMNKNSKSS